MDVPIYKVKVNGSTENLNVNELMSKKIIELIKIDQITLPEDLNGEAIRLSQLNARVKNIEVVYNEVVLVIKGLSLKVEKGEIVSLLGANGAGKSTTLKAVSSLLKNEDGELPEEIFILGKEITNSNPSEIVKGLFQVMEGKDVSQI